MPNFFALLFMLYAKAAQESYKFEREIQIQGNDLTSLAASLHEKLLGEHFQKAKSSSKVEWTGAPNFWLYAQCDWDRAAQNVDGWKYSWPYMT